MFLLLQPTSRWLVFGLVALGVLTLVWAIFVVPGKTRSKWRGIGVQALAVLLSVLMSLLAMVAVLNRQNDWFPSWTSIVGSSELLDSQTVGAAKPTTQSSGWRSSSEAKDPRKNPAFKGNDWNASAAKGQFLKTKIPGQASRHSWEALVWLPPSYLDHPDRAYPVIVAFSGVPGNISAYRDKMKLGERIVAASEKKEMREAIVVAPTTFPDNQDTECVDSVDGSLQVETYVTKDVVPWIKKNLRVVDDPEGWATIGYSAGGWCSSMFTVRHHDLFRYSLNMSGYFAPDFPKSRTIQIDEKAYDLGHLARTKPQPWKVWFATAKDDPMPMRSHRAFAKTVTAPSSLTTQYLDAGGHSWKVWGITTPAGLKWLGQSAEFGWVQP